MPAGLVGTHAAQLRVRPQHHPGVPRGRRSSVGRDFTTAHTDSRRSDWYVYSYGDGAAAGRPQGHFDFECTTLNYVLPAGRSWPQLSWTGATIKSDEDQIPKGFEKWWIEAAFLAFGKIRTEEQRKRSHHAPVNVTPFVVSAGGGIMDATDALLPSAKGRSGRHYERQHLSGILLKYRHRLAAAFVSVAAPEQA